MGMNFNIGNIVDVTACIKPEYVSTSMTRCKRILSVYEFPVPMTGVVTGATFKMEGEIEKKRMPLHGEQNRFCETCRVTVWLVRFGMFNKEVEVLEQDIVPTTQKDFQLPATVALKPFEVDRKKEYE